MPVTIATAAMLTVAFWRTLTFEVYHPGRPPRRFASAGPLGSRRLERVVHVLAYLPVRPRDQEVDGPDHRDQEHHEQRDPVEVEQAAPAGQPRRDDDVQQHQPEVERRDDRNRPAPASELEAALRDPAAAA